jgi:protein TonB
MPWLMPGFPGGTEALVRFLKQNLQTPEESMESGSRVTVKARFEAQRDGSIGGIEILQSGGKDFDEEVVRVLNKMPIWAPGSQNGRNVAVYFTLPIVFEATGE